MPAHCVPVTRPIVPETTALGAAYAAGLAVGFWPGIEVLKSQWQADRTWTPSMSADDRSRLLDGWRKAVERSFGWVS